MRPVRLRHRPQAFRMDEAEVVIPKLILLRAARYLFRLTRRKDAEKQHECHYEVAEVVCFAPGNCPGAFVDIWT